MGQKINPLSMRLQVHKQWRAKWFNSGSDYSKSLVEDLKLRQYIERNVDRRGGINRIDIDRAPNLITITLHSAKPGVIIGRGGSGIEELKLALAKRAVTPIKLTIEEIKKPELRAKIVAENIAGQIEKRISYRRAMKMAEESAINAGAKGVKIAVAGRLNGAEMSRRQVDSIGSIPLHTLRADIDYAQTVARTTFGAIGIKVWIYREELEG